VNRDQLAAHLLATFLAELEEQVRAMNADLVALEAEPADAERLKSLFRVVHTLKGAARAVAVAPIEHACHALETLLAEAREGKLRLEREDFALLFSAADALAEAGLRLKAGRDLAGSPLTFLSGRLKAARPGAGGRSGRRHGGEAEA
jgi:two-component system chemotaxis sensor kinase CheA